MSDVAIRPRHNPVRVIVVGLARAISGRSHDHGRTIAHTIDLQRMMVVLAVLEAATAVLLSMVVPSGWKIPHILAEIIAITGFLGVAAAWRTAPHIVNDSAVTFHTGLFGDISVSLTTISRAYQAERTVRGRGIRVVAGDNEAIACSVTAHTNLVIDLTEPREVRIKGRTARVRRIRVNAVNPRAAAQLINGAVSS